MHSLQQWKKSVAATAAGSSCRGPVRIVRSIGRRTSHHLLHDEHVYCIWFEKIS